MRAQLCKLSIRTGHIAAPIFKSANQLLLFHLRTALLRVVNVHILFVSVILVTLFFVLNVKLGAHFKFRPDDLLGTSILIIWRRVHVHFVSRVVFTRGKAFPCLWARESGALTCFDYNFNGFEGVIFRVTETQNVRHERGTRLFHFWLSNFIQGERECAEDGVRDNGAEFMEKAFVFALVDEIQIAAISKSH